VSREQNTWFTKIRVVELVLAVQQNQTTHCLYYWLRTSIVRGTQRGHCHWLYIYSHL